ncbi:chloride channel protein [filamentous cyanobacterium LEGE 11480]|uniref:Chloride channel protein n=1 Tax=Romeriopsis navalis LEGE 11480 TaxID=2777977 RepID=A0A928VNM1_9CYAN|nr:chloride channel protein [Romeriopsis navalis]MBE9030026.1 chloride channel protein [Romeriopsis navalis LEGE 11480]
MSWQDDWFKRIQATFRPTQIAVFEACVIGLLSGLAAVFLKQSVGFWGGLRLNVATQYPAWIVLPLIGAIGGGLSGLLIDQISKEAAGSGIPEIKIALAGLPTRLNLRLAIAKILSTLLNLSSGFPLGRQGPTVQIGAAIAAQFSRWFPTSPEHRRQLIAAGAAAGLAAGFNAPIAGVLFVIEELLQDVSGMTLGTAILASFVGAVVSRFLGGESIVTQGLMQIQPEFHLVHIPLFLLLGALLGVLGVFFVKGILLSRRLQQRWMPNSFTKKIAIVGAFAGIMAALLPAALRDSASLHEVSHTSGFTGTLLALVFGVKLILTLFAAGSGAPGGIFAPSLVLGSTFGYLFAYGVATLAGLTHLDIGMTGTASFTSTFALTGMAAFFSAVTRGPVTAIIIVFEMTGDFDLVLPLMIGSVTAYWVGESLHSGSIYQYLLQERGIQLQTIAPSDSKLANLTAADLMQRQVESLASDTTVEKAKALFLSSHHRGFPVVTEGELIGILTQSDLTRNPLLDATTTTIAEIMTAKPVTVRPYDALSQVLYLLNRYQISRLPVVDHHKLVGIITRADIIRAESEQLTGSENADREQFEPSYLVYQTREPEIGVGRLLVPIANPATAGTLLKIAATIAQKQHYEIECVHILLIPTHLSPAETWINPSASRALVDQAAQLSQRYEIAVHTQVRVGHSIANTVLEIIQERLIDLLVMGWSGTSSTPGFVFGNVVDTLVQQANCRIMLVKLPVAALAPASFERWLMPTAGGPNSRQAMRLLPGLMQLGQAPTIYLCNIARPNQAELSSDALKSAITMVQERVDAPVQSLHVCSPTIAQAIVDLAMHHQCDVVMLGATRTGMLQQAIKGNIPQEIARRCDCTVIIVREAMG